MIVGLDVHDVTLPAHVGVMVGEIKLVAGHYQVATRPPWSEKGDAFNGFTCNLDCDVLYRGHFQKSVAPYVYWKMGRATRMSLVMRSDCIINPHSIPGASRLRYIYLCIILRPHTGVTRRSYGEVNCLKY